jgi:PhnB protein
MANHMPEGASPLSPYLTVNNTGAAIDFYKRAFGAEEVMSINVPDTDRVMHAEIRIGGTNVMLSDENKDWGTSTVETLGGSPVSLHIYVEDADATVAQAIEAGAELAHPMAEMFWGDRMGSVICPFGFKWSVATHVRDVDPADFEAGARAMMAEMGG